MKTLILGALMILNINAFAADVVSMSYEYVEQEQKMTDEKDTVCVDGRRCHGRFHNGTCKVWQNYTVCGEKCHAEDQCIAHWHNGACKIMIRNASCK